MENNIAVPVRLLLGSVCAFLLVSCHQETSRFAWHDGTCQLEVSLEKKNDSLHILHLTGGQGDTLSSWKLPYPVYRFDYGDVTGDGVPEVIVGVIKPTRYDLHTRKRLFIFRIAQGQYIRPLWFGSRVGQPLEDFRVIRSLKPAHIRTMERERDGRLLVADYTMGSFGLTFKEYIKKDIEQDEAERLLKQ